MNEQFLHHIWGLGLFNKIGLRTTENEEISIYSPGFYNYNSGADYSNARIKIGKTIWAGNVEIHLKSSDWFRHGHQLDPSHKNTILHVVFENDYEIEGLPCLELKEKIEPHLLKNFETLHLQFHNLPCEHFLHHLDSLSTINWMERLAVQRLQRKTEQIEELLELTTNDWEQVLFILVSRYLGMKVNSDPMEILTRAVPRDFCERNRDNKLSLEAVHFGIAGFLGKPFKDEWHEQLYKEFIHQKKKWNFKEIDASMWKYGRLRPANFPSVRISQLAALSSRKGNLFDKILEIEDLKGIYRLFDLSANSYWREHSRFGVKADMGNRINTGHQTLDNLVINAIVPLLFAYSTLRSKPELKDRVLRWLEEMEAEDNKITRIWRGFRINPENSLHSQGLIELYTRFCVVKLCLNCNWGNKFLNLKD